MPAHIADNEVDSPPVFSFSGGSWSCADGISMSLMPAVLLGFCVSPKTKRTEWEDQHWVLKPCDKAKRMMA